MDGKATGELNGWKESLNEDQHVEEEAVAIKRFELAQSLSLNQKIDILASDNLLIPVIFGDNIESISEDAKATLSQPD